LSLSIKSALILLLDNGHILKDKGRFNVLDIKVVLPVAGSVAGIAMIILFVKFY